MKKSHKRGKRILVMLLVFAILCTSLPCTPTIPVHAAQTEKNGTWYKVSARINASWGGHIAGEITLTNVSSQTRQDWQIVFPWQAQISSMWNGHYEQADHGYLITPMEYNRELAPEASVSVGFMAEGEDSELIRLAEEDFFQEARVSITDAEERENMTPAPSVDVNVSPIVESTVIPTAEPTENQNPTAVEQIARLTEEPTTDPTAEATVDPTTVPAENPDISQTVEPAVDPTAVSPTVEGTENPTSEPTISPTVEPTMVPTANPTVEPAVSPTAEPTVEPTAVPTNEPTENPTAEPTIEPTAEPIEPTAAPTPEPEEDLYIYTDTSIREDLVCGNLFLMGGSLECNSHSITVQKDYFQNGRRCSLSAAGLTVAGSMRIAGGSLFVDKNSLIHVNGDFIAQNADSIYLQNSAIEIGGDLDCSTRDMLRQYYGSIEIGGSLIIRKGQYSNYWGGESRIKGDIRILEEGWLYLFANQGGSMEVEGDVRIDSQKSSGLQQGKLAIHGDLIQTEESAENSLLAGSDFTLEFCGENRQKLEIAHPETTTLGTLDFRKSPGVETPDIIRGKQLWGFAKIGKKESLQLELSDMRLIQDEVIDSKEVDWKGSIQGEGYDFTVNGDLSMYGGGSLSLNRGKFQAESLQLQDMKDVYFNNEEVSIRGDLDCSTRDMLRQYYGSTEIGGSLIIRKGQYSNYWGGESRIKGDIRILEEGWLYLFANQGGSMEVEGDIRIDSQKSSGLQQGKLVIHGDLIQTEESAENSLLAGSDFTLEFCGENRQKLEIAHPETTTLGTLDFRKSPGVETPDIIRGKQLWGFAKIGKKESLQLELSDMRLIQDEVIDCKEVDWKGSIQGDGYDLTVSGDLSMYGGGSLSLNRGKFQAESLQLQDMNAVYFNNEEVSIRGDLDCSTRDMLRQYYGSTEIGGSLIIRKGQYSNYWGGESRIKGDVRILEEGWLYLYVNEGGSMEVEGDVRIDSQKSSRLEQGRLAVHGDLIQTEESIEDSFILGRDFSLACCGNGLQTIDLPDMDEIPNLDLSGSKAVRLENDYEGSHLYGLEKIVPKEGILYSYYDYNTITEDTVLNVDLNCGGELDIGDHSLTVNGSFRQKERVLVGKGKFSVRDSYTAVKGALWITGGSVRVGGNMSIRQDAGLHFNGDPNSCLRVDGNLTTASGNEADNRFASGTLEVRGNLTQQPSAGSKSLYMDTTKLVLSGDQKQVVTLQNVAGESYLHNVDLTGSLGVEFVCAGLKADGIIGMEHITNELLTIQDSRLTLQQDETYYGELAFVNSYLDCNGYRLHTGGAVTQSDSIFNLDRGALHVDKDYNILGSSILQMIRYEDRVYVGGNFATASSLNHSSMLCAGRMEIMGDFDQSGDPNSFTSSELFTMAFLGSGTHKAHFMENRDPYFANVDPDYNDVEYVSDSISVTTTAIYIGMGMVEGLADALLDPTMVVITGAFLAAYGISAAFLSVGALMKAVEVVALILTVLSVYSMLKAGDELGDALNGDYSEEERAEQFGKAAIMLLLAAGAMYGSMAVVMQPKMLRSIAETSKNGIGKTFSEIKSFVKIFTIQDADSMLLYCEEFLSGPALQTLKEAVKGCDIKQLHEIARMVREASKKTNAILKEDDLVVALENWRETGDISKAIQIAVNWIKWIGQNKMSSVDDMALKHSAIGDFTYNSKTGAVSKMKSGGHSQANIDFLQTNGIKYNIVKEYDNGVRIGNVPGHKVKAKRTGTNQSWFPRNWTGSDIAHAGEYVGNLPENRNVADGVSVFGEFKGVRVGIIRTNGRISTIFPDAELQP